jgi:predicted Zn-dependent protease
VAALVFGPGLPPGGVRGTLAPTTGGIEVRAGERVRTAAAAALAPCVLLPVLLLLLLFVLQAGRIVPWVTRHVPVETEQRLGRAAFADLRRQLVLEDAGPAHAAVQALGARLTQGARYRYEFHVARDPAVNAFALPGGIVVVHSGVIAATSRPEELAGVLAHEIEHVERRHALAAMAARLGLRALWLLATGDVGGTLGTAAALELASLRFSRAAELEADAGGFDRLVARGIDPSGMAEFFAALAAREGAAPPAFLSTHPASAERARALAAPGTRLGARRFVPLAAGRRSAGVSRCGSASLGSASAPDPRSGP